MNIPQKTIKNIKRKFQRDNDFGSPFHKSDVENAQRKDFVSQLQKNKDFVPTHMANDRKFATPIRDIIKNFKTFDYIVIALVGLACGMVSYQVGKNINTKIESINQHRDLSAVMFATFGLLAGLFLGGGTCISMAQENKDSAVESLYRRLSVRLFDLLHETSPDLDEKILRACNPEMSRVIKALLIANMSEKDTREIQSLATEIFASLRDMTPNNEKRILLECEPKIKDILAIVEQNIITNQALHDAIIAVYRGNVPVKFVLNNNQKTK